MQCRRFAPHGARLVCRARRPLSHTAAFLGTPRSSSSPSYASPASSASPSEAQDWGRPPASTSGPASQGSLHKPSSGLSPELREFDRYHVWHPYTSLTKPLPTYEVVGASGVRLELADGRQLIDGMSSWWTAIHGYNHPRLNSAVERQLKKMVLPLRR